MSAIDELREDAKHAAAMGVTMPRVLQALFDMDARLRVVERCRGKDTAGGSHFWRGNREVETCKFCGVTRPSL